MAAGTSPGKSKKKTKATGYRGGIIVGTDFSSSGDLAVRKAAALAGKAELPITLFHSVTVDRAGTGSIIPKMWHGSLTKPPQVIGRALKPATAHANRVLKTIKMDKGLQVERVVSVGPPEEELIRFAKRRNARLVVVGVHKPKGMMEKFFLGSTAERVIREGAFPTLLARKTGKTYKRILVPIDFTDTSIRILRLVNNLFPAAKPYGVHFFTRKQAGKAGTASHARTLERSMARLVEDAGLDPREVVMQARQAEPRAGILKLATEGMIDLIAMGTHGRRGMSKLFLGSVAEYVIRAAKQDVLVVPPMGR